MQKLGASGRATTSGPYFPMHELGTSRNELPSKQNFFMAISVFPVELSPYQIYMICTANRPFPHFTSVRSNNNTRARLGWTFQYISSIFGYPGLDLAPLFVGMGERSIGQGRQCSSSCKLVILFVVIAAAVIVLWLGGIVSLFCSIVLSKGCKPFM